MGKRSVSKQSAKATTRKPEPGPALLRARLGITPARAWALACHTHDLSGENRHKLAAEGAILLHREFNFEVWIRSPSHDEEPDTVVAIMNCREGEAARGIGALDLNGTFVDNILFSEQEYGEGAKLGLRGAA